MRHLLTVSLVCVVTALLADDITWRNIGENWLDEANWNPEQVPGAADTAILPRSNPINFHPSLNGNTSIYGLNINNNYNQAWIVGGSGKLTLGAGGIFMTGSRTENQINVNLEIAGNQTWYFQSSENRTGYSLRLGGKISGSGNLTFEERRGDAISTWKFGHSDVSKSPADFNLNGSAKLFGTKTEVQFILGPQTTSTDFVFGGTPQTPQTLRLDNGGRFRLMVSAPSDDVEIGFLNPIEIGPDGGFFAVEYDSATTMIPGDITLGGPFGIWRSNANPLPQYGGVWTLPQDRAARCGILTMQPGYDLPSHEVAASLVDGAGPFANPLLIQALQSAMTLNGTAENNSYAHGSVVDYCGTPYKAETQVARVVAATRLGRGGLKVLPGGKIRLESAGALAENAPVKLESSSLAMAVVETGYDGLPNLTADSHGVIALGTQYNTSLDMKTLGDGFCFLGTHSGATFAGDSLAPAADGIWRLGAGGGTVNNALTISKAVLTGNHSLQVGSDGWQGNGYVTLTAANTFSGDIDVTGLTYFDRDPGPVVIGSQLGLISLSNGNAWGDPDGTIFLHNSRLYFYQSAGGTPSAHKAKLKFEGRSRINLNFNNYTSTLIFGELERVNRGTLHVYDTRSSLGNLERLKIENPPTETNGIVPAWLVKERGTHFLTLAPDNGYVEFAGYKTDLNAATATDVVNSGAAALTSDRTCFALRNSGVVSGNHTLNIGAGGLLMVAGISCDINFGSHEGLVYAATTAQMSGSIAGSNGLTISGNRFHSVSANTFTGPITVNGSSFFARFDEEDATYSFGDAANPIFLNGGALARQSGDCILASRTITLGAGGGFINGISTIHAKITGTGILMIGNGGGLVTITNKDNDYSGGTFLLSATGDRVSGSLLVTENASLGTGDLSVNADLVATLEGNANLSPAATAQVAMQGKLRLQGTSPLIGGLVGGGLVELGTAGSATALTVGGANTSSTFYGRIAEMASAYPGSLTKIGKGRFTLYGEHDFTGATIIESGEFALHGKLAGDLSVGENSTLVAFIDPAARPRPGHVEGDVVLEGVLSLDGPGCDAVPIGTEIKLLTCEGQITNNLLRQPDGYSVTVVDQALVLSHTGSATVITIY